jgi:hypothetical protein
MLAKLRPYSTFFVLTMFSFRVRPEDVKYVVKIKFLRYSGDFIFTESNPKKSRPKISLALLVR